MTRGWRLSMIAALTALAVAGCAADLPPGSAGDAPPTPKRAWLPEGEVRAAILAIHGFNDYSNAFAGFGRYAADRSVAVHAYDQRGFGANPDAGLWPGTDRLVEDLIAETAHLRAIYPGRPVYLLGASMGAAVTIAAMTDERPPEVEGVILAAPAVWGGDQLNPFYRATLWLTAAVAPGLRLTGRQLDILPSDNIEMLRAFSADPLVIKATRVDAIAGLVALMDRALAGVPDLDGRLLILTGARDQVVPTFTFEAMHQRLTAEDCTIITYPDGYHMLLRDLQRAVVWNDILTWIEPGPVAPEAKAAIVACQADPREVAAASPH
jgi:alpha-beta hydrolase superfamily lysophospholipase